MTFCKYYVFVAEKLSTGKRKNEGEFSEKLEIKPLIRGFSQKVSGGIMECLERKGFPKQ